MRKGDERSQWVNAHEHFESDKQYDFADGSRIRVDRISGEFVYFVAWMAGQETGRPARMEHTIFYHAFKDHEEESGGQRD